MFEKTFRCDELLVEPEDRPEILLITPGVREVSDGQEPLDEPWGKPEIGVRRIYNSDTKQFTEQEIVIQIIQNPRFI